ncbi:MAG TPA: hypothetical protein VMG12_12570 [Polyangiaceae bacterium]|nr:hypothetical protein [Polyangiaceae bacterium]
MTRLRLASFVRLGAFITGLAACCIATGCGSADNVQVYPGGQTGGEQPQPSTGGGCEAQYTELALDEVAPFGATAASVLEPVLGTHTAPLLWSSNTGNVSIGPEQGLSDVELGVSYQGGRIAWAHFVPREGDGSTGAVTALGCAADQLEVELDVQLRTGGGALAEHFVTTLAATTPDNAQIAPRLTLDALAGSFFVTAPRGTSVAAIRVTSNWDVFGFRGTVDGEVTMMSGDPNAAGGGTVGFGYVPFAAWPPPGNTGTSGSGTP